jgi:hypothetical protein
MENKVPIFAITLREFRIIHLAKEGLYNLLLCLLFLLVLNSCSKEVTLDEVMPSSVETTSGLKEWATKNDKLNQANLIDWDNSTPISLSDSIKGYSAPVKTASGLKEFITFELEGKRHGWYKSYKRLNETDMEIMIQTLEGKTLKSGVLHKSKNVPPKGKIATMREMHFEEGKIVFENWLDWVTVSAPRLYPPGDYVYVGTYQFEFKAFYDSDSNIGGSGGAGSSSLYFEDFNTTRIVDKLTDPCFKAVLNDLINKNVNNVVGDIVRKFVNDLNSKITFIQQPEVKKLDRTQLYAGFYPNTNVIALSESQLKNASNEFIAITIIHEIFHAKIRDLEQIDHTKIFNEYVKPTGEYMASLYNIDERTAQNLLLDGLKDATGYKIIGLYSTRWLEVKFDVQNYVLLRNAGSYCK